MTLGPGKRLVLDERLKILMQELGNAINESLSDSERIAGAIGEIKRAGYDVFLVLEATIGFNKRDEGTDVGDGEDDGLGEPEMEIVERPWLEAEQGEGKTGCIRFTSQDQKFLRALKIATDEPEN